MKKNILFFDGAMGTYFSSVNADPLYKCEHANITDPETIKKIHTEYLSAGANAIKTNTFCLDSDEENEFSRESIIESGYKIAHEVASKYGAYVFADIGYIRKQSDENVGKMYCEIAEIFMELGAKNFLFETLCDDEGIEDAVSFIKDRVPDAYIVLSFAVGVDGFTSSGIFGNTLYYKYKKDTDVDAVGFNCVCGPMHLNKIISELVLSGKDVSIMPNSGYPTVIANRTTYGNNPTYFASQMKEIVAKGVKILGGCCGTTPQYIQEMKTLLLGFEHSKEKSGKKPAKTAEKADSENDFYHKLIAGKKPIAVELDSPLVDDTTKFMASVKKLQDANIDMLTIADCPIARARMDSSLLACKVKRELGLDVMPHLTCRDRNINASKAMLLGLSVEEIRNVLIVTGDPIPTAFRDEVKTVYQFNSRMLINHINNLNENTFISPFKLYAALNINARNFEKQLELAKKKVENGAVGFFTQPVHTDKALENLKHAKRELAVPIVVGILPVISHKNGEFMNNEVPGIEISQDILDRYKDKTKAECTQIAKEISCEIIDKCIDYADGFYLITLFGRVDIIGEIAKYIHGK